MTRPGSLLLLLVAVALPALAIFAAAPRAAAQDPPTASEVRIVTPAEEKVRESVQSFENPIRPWADSGENWAKHPLGGQLGYHMHRVEEGTGFKVTIELNSSGRDKWGIPTKATRTGDVTVTLAIDGAAYGGDDMFSIAGGKTVTIPAGQTSVEVLIEAKDDSVYRWTNLNWARLRIASITKAAGDNAALNPTNDTAISINYQQGHRGVRIGVHDNDPQPDKSPGTIANELGRACNKNSNTPACKALLNKYPDAPTDLRATAAPDGKKKDPDAEEEQTVIVVEPPKIVVIIDGEEQEPEQQQKQEPPKEEPAEDAPAQPRAEPTDEPEPQHEQHPQQEDPPAQEPAPEETVEPTPEQTAEERLIAELAGDDGCISQDERSTGATRIQNADLTTINQSQAYRMFHAAYC